MNIFTWLVKYTSEYKRIYEISNRYPDICLTIVANAFTYALFDNSPVVTIKHFYKAICNAKSIYPDALAKEKQRFITVFADMIRNENVDINDTK